MALDILVRILGDASDVKSAVSEADTTMGTVGEGINVKGVAGKIGGALSGALKSVNWLQLALTSVNWLMEGLDKAVAQSPQGAQFTEATTKLSEALDKLRNDILQPLIPVITTLLNDWLIPLITKINDLVLFVLPGVERVVRGIGDLVRIVGNIAQLALDAFNALLTGAQNVIKTIKDTLDTLLGPLQDILDKLGIIKKESQGLGDGLSSSEEFGYFPPNPWPFGSPMSVTVNTGADPSAVVRAVRTYSRWHGGRSAFDRALRNG